MDRSSRVAATGPGPAPESALRESILRCSSRLAHAARLAGLEAGVEPLDAAGYLLLALDDLQLDLARLRRAVNNPASR